MGLILAKMSRIGEVEKAPNPEKHKSHSRTGRVSLPGLRRVRIRKLRAKFQEDQRLEHVDGK